MRVSLLRAFRVLPALLLLLVASSAWGQATRTWISGVGDDVNPCSRTAPCKTFAGAISKTAAGGVINTLDGGGFGGVTITKPITIDGSHIQSGVLVSGTFGIVVNLADPGTGDVVLRGLTLHGINNATTGVRILRAGSVLIENLQIQNFTTAGIEIAAAADVDVTVRNSSFSNIVNSNAVGAPAILVGTTAGAAAVDVDSIVVGRSGYGVFAGPNSRVHVKNAQVHNASVAAFTAAQGGGSSAEIVLESSKATDGSAGVSANGAASRVTLSGTTLTGNASGIVTTAGGSVASFGDNRIFDNASNGQPTEELGNQ